MASRQSIEAGKGHVSLGVDDSPLRKGLDAAQAKFAAWGKGVMAFGAAITSIGFTLAAPLAASLTAFASYEQALANLRAVANPTAEQMNRLQGSIENLALETGISPSEVAEGFTELLRAGNSAETVLNGLGDTAIRFSQVSAMPMAEAAIVLSDALNAFSRDGLSAAQMANVLSRAADSSSVSVRDVAQSFATAGPTLSTFNQTAQDTATAIAILGNAGLKAEIAGTSLKTLFSRLAGVSTDGTTDAADAMRTLGLVVRDSRGEFLPLIQIVENAQEAFARFGSAERDRLLIQLTGTRGIQGLTPLLRAGRAGWDAMNTQMFQSLSVNEKFAITMNTLSSQLKRAWVAITMVAIAVGEALAPRVREILAYVIPVVQGFIAWVRWNGQLIDSLDRAVRWIIAAGLGIIAFGAVIYALSIPIGVASTLLVFLRYSLGIVAGGFGLVSVAAWAWGALVWVVSSIVAVAFFAVGIAMIVLKSGFGILTLATFLWGLATMLWTAIVWVGMMLYGAALGVVSLYLLGLKIATFAWGAVSLFFMGAVLAVTLLYKFGLLAVTAAYVVYTIWTLLGTLATIKYMASLIGAWIWENLVTAGAWLVVSALVALVMVIISIVALMAAATLAAFALTWALFGISVACEDTEVDVEGLRGAINDIAAAIASAASSIVQSLGRALGSVADFIAQFFNNFMTATATAFDQIVEIVTQAFMIIRAAMDVGEWAVVWETFLVAAQLVWIRLYPAVVIFRDGVVDLFREMWNEIEVFGITAWHRIRQFIYPIVQNMLYAFGIAAAGIPGMAEVGLDAERMARTRLNAPGDAVLRDQLAARALDVNNENEVRRVQRIQRGWRVEEQDNVEAARRGRRLIDIQWELAEGGGVGGVGGGNDLMAQIRRQMQEIGGGGQGAGQTGISSTGTFNRFAAMGFMGANVTTESEEARNARLARENLDEIRRLMARQRNVVMQ